MTSQRKRRGTGRRRRAREMAVQMLYQREMGQTPVPQIFESFDIEDYITETESVVQRAEPPSGETPAPPPRRNAADDESQATRRRRAEESFRYAQKLVQGTLADGDAIDGVIRRHAENWRLERMPPIDRSILRLAIYEMLRERGVPKVVIVDEAIELAKKFGSENSSRFVNGLLDGVLKSKVLDGMAVDGAVSSAELSDGAGVA
ncbi:MAG: transcription antitermination factor NusB [Acidobacteriota bacterium]